MKDLMKMYYDKYGSSSESIKCAREIAITITF